MAADLFDILVRANLALAAAVMLTLLLRGPVRRAFGAQAAYFLWIGVPAALAAALAPSPVRTLPGRAEMLQGIAGPTSAREGFAEMAAVAEIARAPAEAALRLPDLAAAALTLWAAGVAIVLIVLAVRQHRFVRALGRLTHDGDRGVLVADSEFAGPLVLGGLRPRMVLPADFDHRYTPAEQIVILAHERVHMRRGDAHLNTLAALLQAVSWFNPLVHFGVRQFRLDQELACDDAVLASYPQARGAYAQAMLKTLLGGPVAPLACAWPSTAAKVLEERLEMLRRPRPTRLRRIAGGGGIAIAVLVAGGAAWAERPARVVTAASSETHLSRDLLPAKSALGDALIEAAGAGRKNEAIRLIRAGASVDYRSNGDGTPLISAARNGQREMVDLLLAEGAEIDLASSGDGNPLIMASGNGHLEVARALVRKGAAVNVYVPGDETPLMNAARKGSLPVIEFLITAGADVNQSIEVRTLDGRVERRSPVSEALKGGHARIVDQLRDHGARD